MRYLFIVAAALVGSGCVSARQWQASQEQGARWQRAYEEERALREALASRDGGPEERAKGTGIESVTRGTPFVADGLQARAGRRYIRSRLASQPTDGAWGATSRRRPLRGRLDLGVLALTASRCPTGRPAS